MHYVHAEILINYLQLLLNMVNFLPIQRFSCNYIIVITRGKRGLRLPSPLVWVAGATLISSEEVVSSELINLFECNVCIKNKLIVS